MRSSSIVSWRFLFVILFVLASARTAGAQFPPPFDFSQFDQEMYEFVGQVKNFPPAGPGLPATSVQYGYLSHVNGLNDDAIYLAGMPQKRNICFAYFLQ